MADQPDISISDICDYSSPPIGVFYYDRHVIVTYDTLGIQIYNVDEQQGRQSWSLKPGNKLTNPTIRHSQTGNLVAVENSNTILTWTLATKSLDLAHRKLVESKIFQLHVSPSLEEILAVCTDGSLLLLSSDLSNSWVCASQQGNSTVVFSELLELSRDTLIAVVLRHERNHYLLDLFTIKPRSAAVLLATHSLQPPSPSSSICTLSLQLKSRTISVFWSSGTWQVLRFEESENLLQSLQLSPSLAFQHALHFFALPSRQSSSFGSCVGSLFVAPSVVALIGLSSAKPGHAVVTVWETLYGTLQATQYMNLISEELEENTKKKSRTVSQDIVQVCMADDSSLLVLLPRALRLVAVHSHTPSLASVLGRMRETAECLAEADRQAVISPPLSIIADPQTYLRQIGDQVHGEVDVKDEMWGVTSLPHNQAEQRAIDTLTDSKTTSTSEEFMNAFQEYLAHLAITPSAAKTPQNKLGFSPYFVGRVAWRCVTQPQLQLWKPLNYLVCSGCLSARSVPALIPTLLQHNQLELVKACLLHVPDLLESDLVRVLCYALDNLSTAVSSESLSLLELVVSSPRNDAFVQAALRGLTPSQLLGLLRYLNLWCEWYCDNPLLPPTPQTGTRHPSFEQVVEWITLAIDSHMSSLVSMAASTPILENLLKIVSAQSKLCDKMHSLHGLLRHCIDRSALPQSRIPDYGIEIIEL